MVTAPVGRRDHRVRHLEAPDGGASIHVQSDAVRGYHGRDLHKVRRGIDLTIEVQDEGSDLGCVIIVVIQHNAAVCRRLTRPEIVGSPVDNGKALILVAGFQQDVLLTRGDT